MSENTANTVRVWDLFVRVFHWSLVAAITTALVTGMVLGATWIQLHIIAGVTAGALVLTRVIWGLLGTTYARFGTFIVPPKVILAHFAELRAGKAPRHLGHNPLGGLMILGLIAAVFALVITGTISLGGIFKVGPAGFATQLATGMNAEFVHKLISYGLLALIFMHIAGAVFESIRTKENLPRSMVTGLKEKREGDHESPPAMARPAMFAALAIAALAGLFWASTTLASRPGYGVPTAQLDPTYADECSACHIAYHPSLLSEKSWTLLMANLDDHFGEDATLDDVTTAALTVWLAENSADKSDTKPSFVFRKVSPDAPYTITETPFWKTTHEGIPEATFNRAPIYNNGNCAACHADAETGRFFPANISIPKEKTQ